MLIQSGARFRIFGQGIVSQFVLFEFFLPFQLCKRLAESSILASGGIGTRASANCNRQCNECESGTLSNHKTTATAATASGANIAKAT